MTRTQSGEQQQFGSSQFEIRNSKFMSQPEISHRCTSCGASIRDPAMFCPDCGKPVTRATPEPESQVVARAAAPEAATVTAPDPGKTSDPRLWRRDRKST